jgi:hypothetical protein
MQRGRGESAASRFPRFYDMPAISLLRIRRAERSVLAGIVWCVSSFFLVTNGQDDDSVLILSEMIQQDISGGAEGHEQFPVFRIQICRRSPNIWKLFQ